MSVLGHQESDFLLSFYALSVRTMSRQIIQRLSQANAKTIGERSGSVVECLTRDRGVAYSSLTGVTALCLEPDIVINPSLVLVQTRKTRPDITEKL